MAIGKKQKLTSGIDLNEIKQKAQELGMKPADESQIVYYEIEHKNYMNQYEDVEWFSSAWIICTQMSHLSGESAPRFRFAMSRHSGHNEPLVL